MPIQIRRTNVPNLAPTGLLPGQLAVEMATTPPKLWCGVPASIDATMRRELAGATALPPALIAAQSTLRGRRINITTYSFSVADLLVRDAVTSAGIIAHGMNAEIQCNVNNVGANGRDQAAAFDNNIWIHFYWIYNPSTATLATIASTRESTDGPTPLPAGFTHWCYIGAIRKMTATRGLLNTRINGKRFFYIDSVANSVVNSGSGGYFSVNVQNYVPVSAEDWYMYYTFAGNVTGGVCLFQIETGILYIATSQRDYAWENGQIRFPNVSPQTFRYQTDGATNVWCFVNGYTLPNGAI